MGNRMILDHDLATEIHISTGSFSDEISIYEAAVLSNILSPPQREAV